MIILDTELHNLTLSILQLNSNYRNHMYVIVKPFSMEIFNKIHIQKGKTKGEH